MGTKKDGVCYPRLVIVGSLPFYSFFSKLHGFFARTGVRRISKDVGQNAKNETTMKKIFERSVFSSE